MKAVDRVVRAYSRTKNDQLTDEQRAMVRREIAKVVHEMMYGVPVYSPPVESDLPKSKSPVSE